MSMTELKKIVQKLKTSSTSDDVLTIKLFKEIFCEVSYPVLHLINTSLRTAVVPDDLKTSVIVPIEKVLNPKNPWELRPINLLSLIDKVLETVVKGQLCEHFEKNDLFFEGQSGFRAKFSCESAIQFACSEWREIINKKDHIVINVFVDLQRAFETIDRTKLLHKLKCYGISENVYKWIECYLQNRQQVTKVNGNVSPKVMNNLGVPQGSVLGPLLFIIFINDVGRILKHSNVKLFADDTLISISGNDYNDCVNRLNEDLILFYDWLCDNKLKLNVNKTKCMVIGSKTNCDNFLNSNLKVVIDGKNIEHVNEMKYLGVIIDAQLTFKNHVNNTIKKIAKKVGFFSRISPNLSEWCKKIVYNTIILPHFQYCSSLLLSCTDGDIQKLQVQQNKCMRVILRCSRYTPIKTMLQKLQWMDVKTLIKRSNIILIFKVYNDYLGSYLKVHLNQRSTIHSLNTRHKNDFDINFVKSSKLKKGLFNDGINYFNKLPNNIKDADNLKTFIHLLDNYLLYENKNNEFLYY